MEFNAENVAKRTKELRDQFGSSKNLAEVAGCSKQTVWNYCSEKYLEKRLAKKEIWEKYFGKWDTDSEETDILEEQASTPILVTEVEARETKAPETKAEAKKNGIVVSAESLAELKELLNKIGYHMEFVAI